MKSATRSLAIETFVYFLRLGCVGFGGPLALIANMQRDLIEKRKWITQEEFSRAFALIKAMPGPVAFMTAVYLGRRRAGWRGGLAAGFALNFPAFTLMVLFSAFYSSWKNISGSESFMGGMQAAALAIVLFSLKGLGSAHRKKLIFWILAGSAAALTALDPSWEPFIILFSGVIAVGASRVFSAPRFIIFPVPWMQFALGDVSLAGWLVVSQSALELGWTCFKAGAFVFGSGLAIVPMMEHDFVTRLGWLTHQEFMDALAFGQITPGPVVITATFIGFKKMGFLGACLATIAIFSAAFFHMMTWFPPLVNRLSQMSWIQSFLTGAIAAVVGAIFATVVRLAAPWVHEPAHFTIMAAVLAAAILTKLPAWSLIPLGGLAGLLARFVF